MTFNALAKALLRRQLRLKLQPKDVLHATPPEFFVEAYTHCASCQQPLFATKESERMAVGLATSAEDFARLCSTAQAAHDCPAKNSPQN